MNDTARTGAYLGGAALLVALALMTGPTEKQPEQFDDQGQLFFEDFTDPLAAAELEVWSFDPESTEIRVFKVQKDERGVWTIPSHGGYPADAAQQMAKSAAMLVGLKKAAVVSDKKEEHKLFAVIDPTEESLETEGRGIKVSFRDSAEGQLASLIIGREKDMKPGEFYVRVPGKKRTYLAKIETELSTKFADWIETDLLQAKSWEIDDIVFDNYSIDEQRGVIVPGERIVVSKDESSKWVVAELEDGKETDEQKVRDITTALGEIKIVGVRRKPEGLTARLQTANGIDRMLLAQSLESKGFFMVSDGSLRSNEGDLIFETTKGVRYTLRFGEIAYGDGDAVTAGSDPKAPAGGEDGPQPLPASNRFLMVTAEFDPALLQQPNGFRMADEEWGKRATARAAIQGIVAAVDSYRLANENRYPESLQSLCEPQGDGDPLLKELQKDPWGNDFVLQQVGDTYAVVSFGADAKEGGDGIEMDIRSDAFAKEDDIQKVRDEWTAYDKKVEDGQAEADKLTKRFGPWYYVIDEELFAKLKPSREGLSKDKPAAEVGGEDK
jgi:hypothetical protein